MVFPYSDFSYTPLNAQKSNQATESDSPDKKNQTSSTEKKNSFKQRLMKKKFYKKRKKTKVNKRRTIMNEEEIDISSIKESASEETNNILVLITEIPTGGSNPVLAPVFITDQKNIFNSGTDFSLKWVGLKATFKFTQKKFPFNSTTMQETLIGSFLHASGTNLGFIDNTFQAETRFYSHYISQIITLKWHMGKYLTTGYGLGSRQYFFNKRDTPADFIMPRNHINIFPRFIINIGKITERDIDKLTSGINLTAWVGYGLRNRWQKWGEPGNLQSSTSAKDFLIYSTTFTAGFLFAEDHNIVLRTRYKGGLDNDFLSQPRFGATIDNAGLDVVHGFTVDYFRVKNFSVVNLKYGFNLIKHIRFNFFFDYGHIFSPEKQDVIGTGCGIRLLAPFGVPLWFTHGIGIKINPEIKPIEHVFMLMAAAGW